MEYVVVTTDSSRRGVFCGWLKEQDIEGGVVELEKVQMVVYYSAETHGVVGLAATGPARGSKVSDAAPSARLNGVTAIFLCSEKARKALEKAPWA